MPTPYEPAAAHPRPRDPGSARRGRCRWSPPSGRTRTGRGRAPARRVRRSCGRAGAGWTPGVSAAVARHLGVSRCGVRWVFVLLTLAGGAGIAAYVFLWALTPEGDINIDPAAGDEHRPDDEQHHTDRDDDTPLAAFGHGLRCRTGRPGRW